ncbi:MAG: class I SAM-dependent methyltransferase [Rikenellaceae bacterium]|jgi:23S rRNA (cytosine1962-C5)-methyltransferase|nr:class I SAM-dependent methyltransferase [Rikenellaceae bacterium]
MEGFKPIKPELGDYELIDSGDFAKLERFGAKITARPEPQAIWRKNLSDEEWSALADATFSRADQRDGANNLSDDRGRWKPKPSMPDRWTMRYDHAEMHLTLRLALTGFKHVGVFPEQAANWNFIYDTLRAMQGGGASAQVLNLFAYTGGATLAARSAGADVTHVDSVKQTVAWARDNMELSGLDGVRWIVDDASKFVQREVRRGRLYDGIVLDPPAYGRGPDGEKWVLEQNIDEMLALCARLLKPHGFLVLNLYSMGLSALVARSAVRGLFGEPATEQFGELYFSDRAGKELPLGVYYRMTR